MHKTLSLVRLPSLLRLALALVLSLPLTVTAAPRPAPHDDHALYLPLVLLPFTGITGLVTDTGAPAVGAQLYLRRYNPVSDIWTLLLTVSTDTQGRYFFPGLETLQPGQEYFILYGGNSTDPDHLLWWSPPFITAYTAGTVLELSSFDIAGITSLAPAVNESITLPYTFKWVPRPATPQDSYSVSFSGITSFGSGQLGYVDSYTLQSLPSGAMYCYYWLVNVWGPDGSHGVQHIDRRVCFNSAGVQRLSIGDRPPNAVIQQPFGDLLRP